MILLDDEHVAALLKRLHGEAEDADRAVMRDVEQELAWSGSTIDQLAAQWIVNERRDYRAVYRGHADISCR